MTEGATIYVKLVLAFVGVFLFLFGSFKAAWAVYSWAKLAEFGQRPALVGNDPRIRYKFELIVAALGAAAVAAAFLL